MNLRIQETGLNDNSGTDHGNVDVHLSNHQLFHFGKKDDEDD